MNSSGAAGLHNPQLWRRSPDVQSIKDPSSPCLVDETGNTAGSKEKVVRIVMGSLSVVDWIRSQWLLWLFLLSICMAYYRPASVDIASSVWVRILVFVSFTLSGASFPDLDKSAAFRFIGPTIAMCVMSLFVSPIIGTAVYTMFHENNDLHYLFIGLMCTFCLPPSAILSVAAARSSQGNEALSQYLSAVGSVSGVIASPLLMLACISLSHSTKLPSTMEMVFFPVTVIGPFFIGIVAQRVFAWISHRYITGEDRDLVRISKAEIACSELCEGSLVYWRQRAVQMNCLVLLLVNYFMFSSFFVQSITPNLLTWKGIGIVSCLEFALYLVLSLVGWCLASMITATPEERIALFFALVTKSEVLVVPIILHLFHENRQAAVILLPSLMYHLIQAFATGVLSFPLRRWRYRYNCRPGTTLLPLRLSKSVRASSTK
ncbi:putative sodium bile acid cotransporter [Trypanosoma melophagium]|uniref:putative sodium bile acid cotransporter n=1 Tax=Trypanosoma melophagium TaxID=715481 RepID=UPI00351A0BFA|nr:putative sodium bile acid cotransporter [Trypanosoma melophagium]